MAAVTMKQVRQMAEQYGAEIVQGDDTSEIQVDAPHGKVWVANLCHFVISVRDFDRDSGKFTEPVAAIREDIVDQMSYGIENCTTPGCEVCEEA